MMNDIITNNNKKTIHNKQEYYKDIQNTINSDMIVQVECSEENLLELQYFFLIQIKQKKKAKLFIKLSGLNEREKDAQRARVQCYLYLMNILYPNTIYIEDKKGEFAPFESNEHLVLQRILPLMEIDLQTYKFLTEKVEPNFEEFINENHFEVEFINKDDKKPKINFGKMTGNNFQKTVKRACINYLFAMQPLKRKSQWKKRIESFQNPAFYEEVKGLSTLAFLIFSAYNKICEVDGISIADQSNGIINACDITDGILQLIENIVFHAGENDNDGRGLFGFRIHSMKNKSDDNRYLKTKFYNYFCGMDNRKAADSESEFACYKNLWENNDLTQLRGEQEKNQVFLKEAIDLNEKILKRKKRRESANYYVEINVCDNSGKSATKDYLKTITGLLNDDEKQILDEMQIGDFFSPSSSEIQRVCDKINSKTENAIHHYGLGLFDSLIASIDGCFIAATKASANDVEIYSTSGDGEEMSKPVPGTQYNILLPLKEEKQQYSNLNSDINYTVVKSYPKVHCCSSEFPREQTFESQKNKEKAIAEYVNIMADFPFTTRIIRFDAKKLGNIEIFVKALLLRLKKDDETVEKNIAICNCEFANFLEIARILAVFYNKNGECKFLENVQLYMNGRKREGVIYDEFWMGGSNLRELFIRVSKLTFAKSFSPRIADILKTMLLKRTVTEKENLNNINNKEKEYSYTPFDLILKDKIETEDGTEMTVFEQNVEAILNMELQEQTFGCMIKSSHMRIGSKIHVDDFYEAELLFHNNYFTNRFAYLLKQRIPQIVNCEENNKVYFVGYENYSEMLLYELSQIYGGETEYCVYEQGKDGADGKTGEERFRRLNLEFLSNDNVQIVFIVPVNSTLTTFNKLEAAFFQAIPERRYHKKPIYLGIIQTVNKGEETDIEEKYWIGVDYIQRKISTKYINIFKENMTVHFLIVGKMNWRDPLVCKKCFPKQYLLEEPLIETDKSSVIPSQMLGLRGKRKKHPIYNTEKNLKRIEELKGYVYEKHWERNKNHFKFYINTETFFERNRTSIESWLEEIKEVVNPKTSELHYDIIVCPLHSSNAAFVESVNSKIFSNASLVIRFEVDKEFRDNFIAKYSDLIAVYNHLEKSGQQASLNFIFVDDEIIKGRTIERVKSLLCSLFPQEALGNSGDRLIKVNVFHSIITLVNRLSYSTIRNYCINPGTYYSYVNVRISHLRVHDNACVLCNRVNNIHKYAEYSSTNASYSYWVEKECDWELKSIDQKPELLDEKPSELDWLHFYCSHRLTETLEVLEDRESTLEVFLEYVNVINSDMVVRGIDEQEIVKSYFYIASNPFICFRKSNREAIFKLLLITLEVMLDIEGPISQDKVRKSLKQLKDKINCELSEESNNIEIDKGKIERMLENDKLVKILSKLKPTQKNLQFLMEQSVSLRSNYIIRREKISQILKFVNKRHGNKEDFLRNYEMLVKELVTTGSDEAKATFLEYLLLFGDEYSCGVAREINADVDLGITKGNEEYSGFFKMLYLENVQLIIEAVVDFEKKKDIDQNEYYIKNYKNILAWNGDDFKETSEKLLAVYNIIKEQDYDEGRNAQLEYKLLADKILRVLGAKAERVEFVCTIKNNGLQLNDNHQVVRCESDKYEKFADAYRDICFEGRECLLEEVEKNSKKANRLEIQSDTYDEFDVYVGEKNDLELYHSGISKKVIVVTFKSEKLVRPIYLCMQFELEIHPREVLKAVRYIMAFRNHFLKYFEKDFSTNLLQQMLETLSIQHQLAKARAGFHMEGEARNVENPMHAAESYFFETVSYAENHDKSKNEEYFKYDLERALYGMVINTRIGRANIKLLTKDSFNTAGLNLGYLAKQIGEIKRFSHFSNRFILCNKNGNEYKNDEIKEVFKGKKYKKNSKGYYIHRDYLRALIIEAIQSAGRHVESGKGPCKVYLWIEDEMLWVKNKVADNLFSISEVIEPALMREKEGISLVTLCEMFCEFYCDEPERRVQILYKSRYLSIGIPLFEKGE